MNANSEQQAVLSLYEANPHQHTDAGSFKNGAHSPVAERSREDEEAQSGDMRSDLMLTLFG